MERIYRTFDPDNHKGMFFASQLLTYQGAGDAPAPVPPQPGLTQFD